MTAPMALTLGRLVLAPVFFAFWEIAKNGFAGWLIGIWVVFGLIEVSDLLDGHIARTLGQESELGKVLDPFADSLSRLTYFICFAGAGIMPLWILLILVYRDVTVAYIRVMASKRKVLMAARLSGKLKAWVYAAAGAGGICAFSLRVTGWFPGGGLAIGGVSLGLFIIAAAVAAWSLSDYAVFFIKNSRKRVDTN